MHGLARKRVLLLWLASAIIACGGQHDPVSVSFSIAESECQEELEICGVSQHTQGIVAEAFEPNPGETSEATGDRVLYADFPAPKGGLAILEISQPPSGLAKVRYREVFRGEISFQGEIISQDVQLSSGEDGAPMLYGSFEFTAVDLQRDTTRRVHSGRIMGLGSSLDPARPWVRSPPPSTVPPVEPETPRNDENPDPETPRPGGPDVSVVVVETAHGCSDPAPESSGCGDPTPSSGGGCDSGGSSSGCEADSFDASGCDGGGSSGCEADSFDASGCDSCSVRRPNPNVNLLHAVWRLFWPILLVGGINRRTRRKLSLRDRCAPADL